MNIFYLDRDPSACAYYHCDKHVLKMILESAQLLCNAHHTAGGNPPYKKTHINHPCSRWVRESRHNYDWLLSLGYFLCKEYTKRYGKKHKTESVFDWLKENDLLLPDEPFTDPPQVVDLECRGDSTVDAYRDYYVRRKGDIATWKNGMPKWFRVSCLSQAPLQ